MAERGRSISRMRALILPARCSRYCEAALAEGMDFIAEDDSAADKLESDLRDRAKSKNQSLDEYIRSLYGSMRRLTE